MLHSRLTLVSKPPIPHPLILYLLSLPPYHRHLLLVVLLRFLPPLTPNSLRVLQWNTGGGLRARSTELLHFLSSHSVDLVCIQEFNFNFSSSFRIPGFSSLRSDRTHSRSGILSPDATHASGGVVTFVGQGLSFSEVSISSLFSLNPYYNYVGSTFLLTTPPRYLFLTCMPPIRSFPADGKTDSFSPSIFPPPEISSFWGTSIAITTSGTQEVLLNPAGKKYLIVSSLLTSSLQLFCHTHTSTSLL